jgi:DNA repair exonuclease SbcCD ATPase subunit
MFKKLTVENFQSWEYAELEFSPGVNIIHGLGTSGKTALIQRATRLLIDNKPLGGKNFSNFAGKKGDIKIALTTVEGDEIGFTRTVHVNKNGEKVVDKTEYSLNDNEPFSGCKDKVPDQIVEKLNLSELCRQKQFDAPFLVMASPGEVGRIINRVTRLEQVDEWVADLKSEIGSNNRKITLLEETRDDIKNKLLKYDDVDELENIILGLVETDKEYNTLTENVDALFNAVIKLDDIDERLAELELMVKAERYVLRAEKFNKELILFDEFEEVVENACIIADRVLRLNSVCNALENILAPLRVVTDEFNEFALKESYLNLYVDSSDKILVLKELLTCLEGTFTGLNDAAKLCNVLNDDKVTLFECITDVESDSEFINKAEVKLADVKAEYLLALKEAGKCPVCYHKMNAGDLKRILGEL